MNCPQMQSLTEGHRNDGAQIQEYEEGGIGKQYERQEACKADGFNISGWA